MLQAYNRKMTVCTGKNAKRMKTQMKLYKLVDKDEDKILRFLTQLETACSLNGVSEDVTLWIMSTFMIDGPELSLSAQMAPHKDDETTRKLPNTGKNKFLHT